MNRSMRAPFFLFIAAFALPSLPGTTHGQAVNETPRSADAAIYQPAEFELGSLSAPLRSLAVSQGYTFKEYTNTTGARPPGAQPATLDNFATLGANGILVIATHGSKNGTIVEAYPLTPAGLVARDARLQAIYDGTVRPNGVRLIRDTDVRDGNGTIRKTVGSGTLRKEVVEHSDYGIGLTRSGIRKVFTPTAHEIVYLASCNGWKVRDAYTTASIEFLGYDAEMSLAQMEADMTKFFPRLSGSEFDGKARKVGKSNSSYLPNYDECSAFAKGGFARSGYTTALLKTGPGNTTVAPIVAWTGVSDACRGGKWDIIPEHDKAYIFQGEYRLPGHVGFDTKMDTSINPTAVVTTDGQCQSTIENARWTGDQRIDFDLVLKMSGDATITVQQNAALSANSRMRLDGNQNPQPFRMNGVGPNRDDFKVCIQCIRNGMRPGGSLQVAGRNGAASPAATLTLSQSMVPVGAPGDSTYGALDIMADADVAGLTFMAGDFLSGPDVLPWTAFSFLPDTLDVLGAQSYTEVVRVVAPANQRVGTYMGFVTVSNGVGTWDQVLMTAVVNHTPVITVPEMPQTVAAGDSVAISMSATDADGDSIRFTTDVLPQGGTLIDNLDGTALLTYRAPDDAEGMHEDVLISAYNKSDMGENQPQDQGVVTIEVPTCDRDIADHDVGRIRFSVTDQGICGFLGSPDSAGSGFVFPSAGGRNRLYIGGLWAGTSPSYVLNRDYVADPVKDWNPATCVTSDNGPGNPYFDADQAMRSVFTDGGNPAPRGLRVTQRSYAWSSSPNDEYVILVYDVVNLGANSLDDLWVGQFMDWDLDVGNLEDNTGSIDTSRDLIYMWRPSGGDGARVGVKALSHRGVPQFSFIQNSTYVWPQEYLTDTDRFHFLSGDDPGYVVHSAVPAADWGAVTGIGPFRLDPGDSVRVGFAILAGSTTAALQANADAAQEKWNQSMGEPASVPAPDAAGVEGRIELRSAAPNPFTHRTDLSFGLPAAVLVHLDLYDVTGVHVRRIVEGLFAAGHHVVVWDGRNDSGARVASGVYFARLEAAGGTRTIRIILIR